MLKSAWTQTRLALATLGIVTGLLMASGVTQSRVKAQDPICVDRPDDQKATPPDTVWVEVGDVYLNEWEGELQPFARDFPIDFYVAGVLIDEMGPNPAAGNVTLPSDGDVWEDAALEAMSVAIRSFTWFRLNYAGQYAPYGGDPHEITLDNTNQCGFWDYKFEGGQQINAQIFRPYSLDVSEQVRDHYHTIVTEHVPDLYLVEQTGTWPIDAEYRSTTGEYTLDVTDRDYLESIYDPVSAIDASGSGPGMGQWGTQRWAMGLDRSGDAGVEYPRWQNFEQILFHYYTGVNLREIDNLPAEGIQSPSYRWNPLVVDWGAGATTPPTMFPDESYNVTLLPQNSGAIDWGDEVEVAYYWLVNNGLIGLVHSVDVANLIQGDGNTSHQISDWPIIVPSELQIGDSATLVFDSRNTSDPPGMYFSNREADAGRYWFPLKYDVCVGGICNLYLPNVLRNHFVCPEGRELMQNGGFEQGPVVWIEESPAPIIRDWTPIAPHSGDWASWLGGYNNADDTLYQEFTVPPGMTAATMHFYVAMETAEPPSSADYDHFYARLRDSDGGLIAEWYDLHNSAQEYVWFDVTVEASGFEVLVGQTLRLSFESTSNSSNITSFVLDDVSLVVHCGSGSATFSKEVIITTQPVEPKIGPLPTKSVPSLPVTDP